VILAVPSALVSVIAQSGNWNAVVIPAHELANMPEVDLQTTLPSLPLALGIFEPLHTQGSYLHADPDSRRDWQEQVGPATGLRVGLVWAGNPAKRGDRDRSIPPRLLLRFLGLAGITYYSLQLAPKNEAAVLFKAGLLDFTGRISDFADTAAIATEMDLIISADTAVAHLAGAMGLPVWTMLPVSCDWRWGLEKETTPWYPSMRLFRQPHRGDWGSVIERVAQELQRLIATRR
jgi:hypothetical protein